MKPSSGSMDIIISGPPDREQLVAEIRQMSQGRFDQWAELNTESGELVIEIYPRRDGEPWKFSFEDGVSALMEAQHRLLGEEL